MTGPVTGAVAGMLAVGAAVSLGGCLLCAGAAVVRRILIGRWDDGDTD